MSNQPNKDRSNRAQKRRAAREAQRVPGRGAGQPIPMRSPEGQPSVTSLAELAKSGGGQVPINIPQLMAKLGVATTERDFWMNAAVQLESQVAMLTGGGAVPSVEDVADAEEEIEDIPVTTEECPGCSVQLTPEAVHSKGCAFEGHIATAGDQVEEATSVSGEITEEGKRVAAQLEEEKVGMKVPTLSPPTELTNEEQAVVAEALQKAEWVEDADQALQREEAAKGNEASRGRVV